MIKLYSDDSLSSEITSPLSLGDITSDEIFLKPTPIFTFHLDTESLRDKNVYYMVEALDFSHGVNIHSYTDIFEPIEISVNDDKTLNASKLGNFAITEYGYSEFYYSKEKDIVLEMTKAQLSYASGVKSFIRTQKDANLTAGERFSARQLIRAKTNSYEEASTEINALFDKDKIPPNSKIRFKITFFIANRDEGSFDENDIYRRYDFEGEGEIIDAYTFSDLQRQEFFFDVVVSGQAKANQKDVNIKLIHYPIPTSKNILSWDSFLEFITNQKEIIKSDLETKESDSIKYLAFISSAHGSIIIPSKFLENKGFGDMSMGASVDTSKVSQIVSEELSKRDFLRKNEIASSPEIEMAIRDYFDKNIDELSSIVKEKVQNLAIDDFSLNQLNTIANKIIELLDINGATINYSPTMANVKIFKDGKPIDVPLERLDDGRLKGELGVFGDTSIYIEMS